MTNAGPANKVIAMRVKSSQPTPNSHDNRRDADLLLSWYSANRRPLPWRSNREPYRIWISEVMLQQTTVAAVVPYYERFMKRFPTLPELAEASLPDVLEYWAGLGYYSRARNLHKAAQQLHTHNLSHGSFPRTHRELAEFPGFGPYTSRAVASLAFDEKVGVLDGNVIRILSRRFGLKLEWWKPIARAELQAIADGLAQTETPADLNQGMMELGATVCTVKSPTCSLCPWLKSCVARKNGSIESLPLKRVRRAREIWLWSPQIQTRNGRVLVVKNTYAPFLKGHWILPGTVERSPTKPKQYEFKGTVTHHDIFVIHNQLCRSRPSGQKTSVPASQQISSEKKWVSLTDLKKEIPSGLIRKAVALGAR